MERLDERLAGHTLVGLDTPVFIYHFEAHPRYLPVTQDLLAGVQAGQWSAVTLTITIMEVAVRPWQEELARLLSQQEQLAADARHWLAQFEQRHRSIQQAYIRLTGETLSTSTSA